MAESRCSLCIVPTKFLSERRHRLRLSYDAILYDASCIAHKLETARGCTDSADSAVFETEREQLSRLRHPNILQLLGIHLDEDRRFLVTEMSHTTLDVLALKGIALSVKMSILCDVARGLYYLRSQKPGIVFKELFPENVHLSLDMKAKIAVVSLSAPIDIAVDIAAFVPPEGLRHVGKPCCDTKWDIYSFGVLSVFVAIHELPTKDQCIMEWMKKLGVDHPLFVLACKCMGDEPSGRLPIEQLNSKMEQLCKEYPYKSSDLFESLKKIQTSEGDQGLQSTTKSDNLISWSISAITGLMCNVLPKNYGTSVDEKKQLYPVADENENTNKTETHEEANESEIALLKQQIQFNQEDFNNERKDRERANTQLTEVTRKLKISELRVKNLESQLNSKERCLTAVAGSTVDCTEETSINKLTMELEAAREELAVKVAQVKQYQKQVEGYKQQLAKQCGQQPIDLTEKCESPYQARRSNGHLSCESASPTSTSAPYENEQRLREMRFDSEPKLAASNSCRFDQDGSPDKHFSYENGSLYQPQSHGPVDKSAPFDQNLTCPVCRIGFRKGEIQLFRHHVHYYHSGVLN